MAAESDSVKIRLSRAARRDLISISHYTFYKFGFEARYSIP